ncbi:hypothetical protein ACJX0J_026741, partial [Zea mays]
TDQKVLFGPKLANEQFLDTDPKYKKRTLKNKIFLCEGNLEEFWEFSTLKLRMKNFVRIIELTTHVTEILENKSIQVLHREQQITWHINSGFDALYTKADPLDQVWQAKTTQ